MTSIASIKTLVTMLREAPTLVGASIAFGDENISAQEYALPYLCVVPTGGQYKPGQGYFKQADTDIYVIWNVDTKLDLYLWAHSEDPSAEALDHVEAIEIFRAQVLQAINNQRPSGLFYYPVSERWSAYDDQITSRYGRALVLTVNCEVSIPDVLPAKVTPTGLTLNASLEAPT